MTNSKFKILASTFPLVAGSFGLFSVGCSHDPRSPRKDYIGMYPDGSIPLPGNFKALHPFEFDDLNIRDETLDLKNIKK